MIVPRLALSLAFLAAACGGSEPPRWTPLAEGDLVRTATRQEARPFRVGSREWTCRFKEDGAWIETRLRRGDWSTRQVPGLWRASVGVRSFGRPADGSAPARLQGDGVAYGLFESGSLRGITDGSFAVGFDTVMLKLESDGEPPDELVLSLHVGRGELANGVRRVVGDHYTGEGLSVWPGERLEGRLEVEGERTLRFATTLEPLRPDPGAEPSDPVVFRVELDGHQVLEQTADPAVPAAVWHALPLPGTGRRTVRVAFQVDGPFAFTNVLSPAVGPSGIGAYGRRPWHEARPDLLVFVADTFRADNLEAYGGEPGITPNLDALAERSLVFARAWSTSTYTLPAHVSMFTGLYPRYAGIEGRRSRLSSGFQTIAGRLSAAGYRTGAVTDRGFLSPAFGLDRGYSFFDAQEARAKMEGGAEAAMEATRARTRSFLEADDGRPVFLFVQSYRVHAPYEVSEETRRRLGERLGIEGTFDDAARERKRMYEGGEGDWGLVAARLRAHYLGGVADLDEQFSGVLRDLDELGFFTNGVLVFASDHGEAFNENGDFQHGGDVFEVEVRVPLFLHGAGIRPGRDDRPASLVDLAPTLSDLAGLAPDPEWHGRSLLRNDGERPLYLFCSNDLRSSSTLGIVDGTHKVLAHENAQAVREGRPVAAFDLSTDPHETVNLVEEGGGWPRELLLRHAARLEVLLEPRDGKSDAQLDAGDVEDLQALGYLGTDR